MGEQTTRLEHREGQVRRPRRTVNVLAVGFVGLPGAFAIGAATEQPQYLTLRGLNIVDAGGAIRMMAFTPHEGGAGFVHFDRNGKARMSVGTDSDGGASIVLTDPDERQRIKMSTLADGSPAFALLDRDKKPRILAMTWPDGSADLAHYDRDGKRRIVSGTRANAWAGIVLMDRKGQATWGESSSQLSLLRSPFGIRSQ